LKRAEFFLINRFAALAATLVATVRLPFDFCVLIFVL